MPAEAVTWVKDMIFYTVDGGKMNRGLATVDVVRTLAARDGKELTKKDYIEAAALGWGVEFLQAFFLVADDLMDSSIVRRGQPCWYKREEVQLIAINDSFILESSVYLILKRYFGDKSYYPQLTDLFMETTRQTELGQLLDLTSQRQDGVIDLSRFTIQRYRSIVKYKTAFYSFYLPVALGMVKAGVTERALYDKAREILCIMGEYFQIQDDVLDCFGAPEVIGKVGTDIQDNKCSWLVVQALDRADKKQRELLERNYGQHDDKKVEKVKTLYRDLNLEQLFQKYEEESHAQIKAMIDSTPDLPREVFEFLLKKIYKRTK
ncbi:fps [Symbiodinium microadriaticum]|nr:fps [Symbiodinium microadriaticum]